MSRGHFTVKDKDGKPIPISRREIEQVIKKEADVWEVQYIDGGVAILDNQNAQQLLKRIVGLG